MARVDSLLSIVVEQGANELRLGSESEPKMLAFGTPTKHSMPKMGIETVRALLGEILTPAVDAALQAGEHVQTTYDAGGLGSFSVTLTRPSAGGVAAVFVRRQSRPVKPIAQATEQQSHVDVLAEPPIAADCNAPAVLQSLSVRAASLGASDLHVASDGRAFVRVNGALRAFGSAPPVAELIGVSPPRTGSFETAFDIPGMGRVRIHAFATAEGLAAAIRLLPPAAPTFEMLNMPVPFDDLVTLPNGLVLVCGATGSGKSTTLAALAQEAMRKRSIALVTLEDPIEYTLDPPDGSLVRRRQIGRDVRDFASGLRDALREDPDVLLVGEMRDAETIALAITAAETGHLVLASIHSRGAASAIERIVDAYGTERRTQVRIQLAESLRAVIGQRLVARARGAGRLPAVEVLRVNHAVAALIREGRTAQIPSAIQSARREGMISLERCLVDRVRAGEISLDEARAAANDADSLTAYLAKT